MLYKTTQKNNRIFTYSRGQTQRGFLTIEVVIALSIFVIIMSAALVVSFNGQTAGLDIGMTKEGVQRALSSIQTDLQTASVFSGYTALASSVTYEGGDMEYTRTETVQNDSPCLKVVSNTYGWTSEKNRSLITGMESAVASIDLAKAMGGGCDPFPPNGGWENPIAYAHGFDAGGPSGNAVDAAFIAGKRIAVVVSDHTSSSDEDFYVLDTTVTDPPTALASIDTGRGDNNVLGLNDVVLANKTAYVLKNFKENVQGNCKFNVIDQLQVVDLTAPGIPGLQPIDISFDTQGVDPCGTDPDAHVIRYYNGKIYIALKTTLGPELLIYDVSGGNRLTPAFFGKLYDGFNHSINDIAVQGNKIYVSTDYDLGELFVIDISNLSTATAVDLPGTLDAKKLFLTNNRLYVGRDRATGSDKDFNIMDLSIPASPVLLGNSYKLGTGPGSMVTGLSVYGKFAFIGSSDTNTPFFVLDISAPSTIIGIPVCSLNWSQGTTDIVYIDNLIFAVNRSNDMMRTIYDRPGSSCN